MPKRYKLLPGHKIEISRSRWFPFFSICRLYRVRDQWTGKIYEHRDSIRLPVITECDFPTGVMDEQTDSWR